MRNYIPVFCLLALFSVGCMEGNNEGRKMTLVLPKDENGPKQELTDSSLVILLVDDNTVFAFNGKKMNEGKIYPFREFRSYLITRNSSHGLVVFIKPGEKSSYKNTVDMLDEMAISNIEHYSLVEPEKEEQKLIDSIRVHKTTPPLKRS